MRYLTILSILLLTGCAAILGIKTPKVESPETLKGYLVQHNMDTTDLWLLKPEFIDTLKAKPFKTGWENGFRPIQFKMFSKEGKLIAHYASCEGPIPKFGVLDQFPPRNLFPVDSSHSLQQDIQMYTTLEGNTIDTSRLKKSKYVILAYWQVFTGTPSRKMLKQLATYTKQYPDSNITLITINTDILNESDLYRYE